MIRRHLALLFVLGCSLLPSRGLQSTWRMAFHHRRPHGPSKEYLPCRDNRDHAGPIIQQYRSAFRRSARRRRPPVGPGHDYYSVSPGVARMPVMPRRGLRTDRRRMPGAGRGSAPALKPREWPVLCVLLVAPARRRRRNVPDGLPRIACRNAKMVGGAACFDRPRSDSRCGRRAHRGAA